MSNVNNAREQAVKALNAAMATEAGRKIVIAKMLSLTEDNKRLKRKVCDDRIAVCALNEVSKILIDMVNHHHNILAQNQVQMDARSQRMINVFNNYRRENFGMEMVCRIDSILADTEGDDILLHDLIGPQPTGNR